jgi:hypothetical protein
LRAGRLRSDKRDINKKQKIPSRIFPKIEYNTPVFAFCGCFGRDLLKKEDLNKEMDNNYFVDSKKLSKEALAKKHELENNPASRADIMAYLPGMEQIDSDIASNSQNKGLILLRASCPRSRKVLQNKELIFNKLFS